MTKLLRILIIAALLLGITAQAALAEKPTNPNCWGVVVSQRATALHDLGEHSSSFAGEPRLGLGNFARLLFDLGLSSGPHISDAATVAAQLDDIEATHCP